MTDINHETLEKLARMLCESSVEDAGRYDRKGCKRPHWRKKAIAFHERVTANVARASLYRACGWPL